MNNSIDVAVYSDEYSDEEFITSPVVVICDQKTTAQGSYAFFKNESYVSLGSNYGEGSCSDLASESDGSSQEENSPADQAGVLQDARKFTPHTQPRQYSPQVELYRSTFALHTIAEEFVTYDDNLLSTVVQEDVVYTVRNRQESACGKIVEARSNLGQDVTIKILAKSSKEVKVIQSLASRRTMFMDKPLAIVLDSRYAYIVMVRVIFTFILYCAMLIRFAEKIFKHSSSTNSRRSIHTAENGQSVLCRTRMYHRFTYTVISLTTFLCS